MNTSTTVLRSSVPTLGKSFLALTALLACAPLTHATILLQENFDSRNLGDLNGQNGWTANTALQVTTGGLSYTGGNLSVSGGTQHSEWTNANVEALGSKAFTSQSGEVWFSLTINVTATTTTSRFFFSVNDDTDLANSGYIGQINTGSQALLTGYRAGSTQYVSGNAALPQNTTLFIVGRYSKDGNHATEYDKMEMWVNPTSTSLGVVFTAAHATAGSGISSGINTFLISALTSSGTGATVLWDNLLVGTTQADVLDVYAIPEPSTYAALGGLAALGLATLRRRRG